MSENSNQKSLVSILAKNEKGVLSKLTTFFANHDMNIESLTLSSADIDNKIQRTTAYITGDRNKIGELCKDMERLEGVNKVTDFMSDNFLERELGLLKIKITNPDMPEITELVNENNGETIFVNSKIMIFQIEEEQEKIDSFMRKAKNVSKDIEILRTGIVATPIDNEINAY